MIRQFSDKSITDFYNQVVEGSKSLFSGPSVKLNTTWECVIKKEQFKAPKFQRGDYSHQKRTNNQVQISV